jgi:hypothetical protein
LEKEVEAGEFADLIERFEFSNFFNSPGWVEILAASFPGFSPYWITARESGRIVGIMPVVNKDILFLHCVRSLPFGTYGTPLADDPAIKSKLVGRFMELASSAGCLDAVCTLFDPGWNEWFSRDIPHTMSESRIAKLDGDFESYLASKVSATKRKTYRRCERAGVTARPLNSVEEVMEFHGIYGEMSRGWGGIHPLPDRFFTEIFSRGGDCVAIMGAFKDGRMMGGHIDFYYGNMAQAWQAGLSKEANRLGAAPYLVLEAVREAYSRNISYFNLGSSSGDEGLIEFKESLGGSETKYPVIKTGKRWWKWIRRR